jgi:CubicO group peptidase (beta-lactamase class C family)
MHPDKWQNRAQRLETYANWKLTHEPGTFMYHATAAHWVLADILESVDGIDYKDAFRQRILEPLDLNRTQLGVPIQDTLNINLPVLVGVAATPEEFEAAIGVKGIDPGEVTDDNAVASAQPEYLAGGLPGGGGVGTAGDLALYYQGLLHNPKKIWDPKWLERCTQEVCNSDWDLLFAAPANRTLGMVVAGDDGRAGARGFGKTNSPRAFGYNGYGGQLAWADPETGLSFSYLTNGIDRHLLRQTRRGVGVGSRAALCAA